MTEKYFSKKHINKFDKSYLPYIVNFTDENSIDEKFYNLIKNDLTEI